MGEWAIRKSLPPLTWFRSFEAAARTFSFTAAAEEIGLTQSAVSQQVKSLETRLGVVLFVRRPRGLSLTDEGRKLLPQVGAALESLATAAGSIDVDATTDVLTVATSVSVAQWVITPHLPSFHAEHPHIRLRLLSAVWPDDLRASNAEVAIQFGAENQARDGARLLEPNRLIAVKAPSLIGKIEGLPLIETVGTSSGWEAWQTQHGRFSAPKFFTDTYGMALQMAVHGSGVALISEVLAQHAIATGAVEIAHPATITGREGYFLSTQKGHPAAEEFERWFLGCLNG